MEARAARMKARNERLKEQPWRNDDHRDGPSW